MRDEYAKLAQENQTLKATIQSYERYYNEQRVNNYKKKKKKKRYYKSDSETENELFVPKKGKKNKIYIDDVDGYYVDDNVDDDNNIDVDDNEIEEVDNNDYENIIEDNNNHKRTNSNVKIVQKPKKKIFF